MEGVEGLIAFSDCGSPPSNALCPGPRGSWRASNEDASALPGPSGESSLVESDGRRFPPEGENVVVVYKRVRDLFSRWVAGWKWRSILAFDLPIAGGRGGC